MNKEQTELPCSFLGRVLISAILSNSLRTIFRSQKIADALQPGLRIIAARPKLLVRFAPFEVRAAEQSVNSDFDAHLHRYLHTTCSAQLASAMLRLGSVQSPPDGLVASQSSISESRYRTRVPSLIYFGPRFCNRQRRKAATLTVSSSASWPSESRFLCRVMFVGITQPPCVCSAGQP